MTKYVWDEKLITSYMLDPDVSPEFEEAFAFLEYKRDTSVEKQGALQVLSRDISFIANNPFVYPVFDQIATPELKYMRFKSNSSKISINEALRLMNFFYADSDAEVYNCFRPIFDKRYTNLMVVSPNKKNQASGYSGHCYCSPKAKDVLIDVIDTSNYEMLAVLTHEFAHATAFGYRGFELDNEDNIVFDEIESIFMEIVANNWFMQNSSYKKEAAIEMKKIYNEVLDCARLFLEVSDLCDMVGEMHSEHKKVNMRSIIEQARVDYTDMRAYYIKRLLSYPIECDTPYGYSALIAIELYQIYLQDPKAVFDLYKRIILSNKKTAGETNRAINQMGITAGEHLEDFARSLKR